MSCQGGDRVVARRRGWEGVGEPLFGEDWWTADQQLFEDSVTARRSVLQDVRSQAGPLPSGSGTGRQSPAPGRACCPGSMTQRELLMN